MGNLFSLDAWNLVWTFKCTFILGFLTTVGVSLSALVISLTLGIAFGLMATSGNKILSAVSRVYVEFIQIHHYYFRSAFCTMPYHSQGMA